MGAAFSLNNKPKKEDKSQKEAVLAHEEGHCKFHHTELRLLTLLFCPLRQPAVKLSCAETEDTCPAALSI